ASAATGLYPLSLHDALPIFASLVATSLNSGSSAIARMQAVSLANDLADRIRANRTAGIAYHGAASNKNCVGGAIGAVTCVPADIDRKSTRLNSSHQIISYAV